MLVNKLISKQQHGFLAKHSTCSQLLECVNDWSIALNIRNSTDVIYIDFNKAFDSVVHSKLLQKLIAYGVGGNLLHWLTSFLTNRTQCVKVGFSNSDFIPVVSGVPQGSVLGPLLFLIYINDLVDVFGSGLTVKLFADDVKIYTIIGDIISFEMLQTGLDALSGWSSKWQLKVSINKCTTLHIGRNNAMHEYAIDGVVLPNVRVVKDLGVLVDSKLSFSAHIAQTTTKAHQRASLIIRCFKSRDAHLLFRAFSVYVRPIVEYCSPVWSPVYKSDIVRLEAVQRRFTKRLKYCSCLSYAQRLIYLKTETLELRRLKQDLITIYKIFHNDIELNINDFFELSQHGITRGHNFKLVKPVTNNNAREFSFACRRINCWNSLPNCAVSCRTIGTFKTALNCVDFSNYLYF